MSKIRAYINKLIHSAKDFEDRLLKRSKPTHVRAPENWSLLNQKRKLIKVESTPIHIQKKPVRIGEIIASTAPSLRNNIEPLEEPIKRFVDVKMDSHKHIGSPLSKKVKPEPRNIRLKKLLDLFGLNYLNRRSSIIILMIVFINLMGSSFVVGLLLSKESVSSSGLVIKPIPYIPPPSPSSYAKPPPEPKIDLDVYSEIECINKKSEIEWGSIEAGRSVSRTLYIKNSGSVDVVLSFLTDKWDPVETSRYLSLSWDYDGTPLKIRNVVRIKLTLTVDSSTKGVDRFSFDVIFIATPS